MVNKEETRIIPEETNPKFFAEHLKPYEFMLSEAAGKKVLEVGCGDGYGSAYLAKSAKQVIGVDYEEEVIFLAQKKYKVPNLEFRPMDATKLDFPQDSFDIICSFQVVEHIPEEKLSIYLTEIKRVLRPSGKLYLSTLNLNHTMRSPLTYQKNPAHCKEFRLNELATLISSVFTDFKIYGQHLTLKHRFYLRLRRIGIFKPLPERMNPVSRFYKRVTTKDFEINDKNLERAIDFICVCKK